MTADKTTAGTPNRRDDHGFLIGLLTGTIVGAGLAIWFAPRAGAELRDRAAGSARAMRARVSDRYEEMSAQAGEAVEDLTAKGQRVRNDMADAVARGALEVVRMAKAVKS